MPYNTSLFIDPEPRVPGFHDAHCRVTWTPRDGEPVTAVGAYLNGDSPTGTITLGCGIEVLMSDLGLDPNISDAEHFAIAIPVNRQLSEHPWAEIQCPEGKARIDLVPCVVVRQAASDNG